MVPTIENSNFFVYLFVNFFVNNYYDHAPVISTIIWKVKYPLRFIVSYVQPVTQQYESRTVQKTPLQSK